MAEHATLGTLELLTVEQAPDGSRELLQAAKAQLGRVPNLYAAMAHSPGLLGTYRFGADQFRSGSGFTPIEQEVILLSISRFHGCTYCVAVHSTTADRSKVPTEVVDAIRDGKPVQDPSLGPLHEFTTAMVASRGRPEPGDLAAFLAAGYTEQQVLGVILAIAVKTISNYTNHVFDTPLDQAFARRAWSPQA
jgi:AhpD family alkylhydroperoxidase